VVLVTSLVPPFNERGRRPAIHERLSDITYDELVEKLTAAEKES
jgi:hypothetical protein